MEEYVLDRRMGVESFPGSGVEEEVDFSSEPPPEDYQIRLWAPLEEGTSPLYGLLLSSGYDAWQVLPFSPYAFPAVPEELRVREDPPARVVQGWNARGVDTRSASASWKVADLPEDCRFLFQRWCLMIQAEEEVKETFADDVGPELRHPLDPRLEYLEVERTRVDLTLGEASAPYGMQQRDLAAETPDPEEEYRPGEEEDLPE